MSRGVLFAGDGAKYDGRAPSSSDWHGVGGGGRRSATILFANSLATVVFSRRIDGEIILECKRVLLFVGAPRVQRSVERGVCLHCALAWALGWSLACTSGGQ